MRGNEKEYLDACRSKRNIVEYEYVGAATEADVRELIEFGKELRVTVLDWLRKNHPELI